jgi:hypothetical protein
MPEPAKIIWTLIKVEGDVWIRDSKGDWGLAYPGKSFTSKQSVYVSTGDQGYTEIVNNIGESLPVKSNKYVIFFKKSKARAAEKRANVEARRRGFEKVLETRQSTAEVLAPTL